MRRILWFEGDEFLSELKAEAREWQFWVEYSQVLMLTEAGARRITVL